MKIIVTSRGNDLSSKVDPRFGRASYFILYETSDNSFEVIDNNQNVQAAHGAGVQAAQVVVSKKPDMVVSGNFGPQAFEVLTAAGIKAATWAEGTVAEAVELAQNDQLTITNSATARGHRA